MDINTSALKGKHVYLELLNPSHEAELKLLAKDERLWEFTKTLLINDSYDDQFRRYFNAALDPNYMSGQKSFVIHLTSNNAIIGMTRFYKIDELNKRLSIGYTWYIPEVWGKVHNKECKLLLLQYIFEVLHFNRAEFEVAHQNIRSQKAVEKIGGVKEGVLRKHSYRGDGSTRDTVVFSIINDEWPSKKEKLLQLISENENH